MEWHHSPRADLSISRHTIPIDPLLGNAKHPTPFAHQEGAAGCEAVEAPGQGVTASGPPGLKSPVFDGLIVWRFEECKELFRAKEAE